MMMNVTLLQYSIAWEDKEANFEIVKGLLENYAPNEENRLIVLPEFFATGFTMESEAMAEEQLGKSEQFLIELAKEKSAHVIGGVALTKSHGVKPANCAVVASPGGEIICRYEKTHPFTRGEEDLHYSQGEKIYTIDIGGVSVSPSVCYDLRFPEVFRIAAHSDTQVYVVIANWPEKRIQHWVTLLQARAIENQAYVIGVNRCGQDPNFNYVGRSIAVDYMGEILADAGSEACAVEASLNMTELSEWREDFPALIDMHDDLSN